MTTYENLRRQLLADLARQQRLILQYAAGDRSVKGEVHRMDGVIEIKRILLGAAARRRRMHPGSQDGLEGAVC